ncbi:MAG: efflux RND transporter permease subunit [bacterium]
MKLADISIRRPVFTAVMMLVLIVFGAWSYARVGVDQFPEIDMPVVTITAVYPGADPSTIESLVIDPLEEAISSISGIDELRSTSAENVGVVVIRFDLEKNGDLAVQDVRDKVSASLSKLPKDLEAPIIQKLDLGAAPIISLVLSGPATTRELTQYADDVLKQKIQNVNGVGNIDLVGGQKRQFQVKVDPYALDAFGLAVTDVMNTLAAQNIKVPGGRLDTGSTEFSLNTVGEVHSADEIGQIIISSATGRPVRIDDVATVLDREEEKRSDASVNGKSAVSLTIQKQSGSNTVAVSHDVMNEIAKLEKQLPKGWEIEVPVNNATFIEHTINDVKFDLLFGAILAVLIIMLFLRDWRATFISAMALPTSVIATVAFINAMGFTFNTMTMLALTLSIGILIDDAIVVIENIHRHLEMGKSPARAAYEGTSEIGLAVLAITASIIAVFIPVATMKGIVGRFFYQFGMTVAFAVAVSLFVAFTLTPMLSARMLKRSHGEPNIFGRFVERILGSIDRAYEKLAHAALRFPIVTILIAVGVFGASLSLVGKLPKEFVPPEDRGEFRVYLETQTGTPLEQTMAITEEITKEIRKVPGVELTFATIGGGAQANVNKAEIHVELVEKNQRKFSQAQAQTYIRNLLKRWPSINSAVEPITSVGSTGARNPNLQYVLQGEDLEELNRTADAVIAKLKTMKGYVDVDKSSRDGKPELEIEIDRDRAADLGVSVADIAIAIRTFYAGEKATEISTDGERFELIVRMADDLRTDPGLIGNLRVRSRTTGQLVPLSGMVKIEPASGPAQIERYNRQRQVTIYSNLDGLALGNATDEVSALVDELKPASVTGGLSGNADTLKDTVRYMIEALLLAIVLIYLILAAQFESFVHPLTIMLSLPLSLIGAFGILFIFNMPISIFTMIGFIMLMGLVTKNAVLLVDYTNVLRREGLERMDALVRAGVVRLRPILMTTAAMIFGMIPVATGMSAGGEQRAPMAMAVIGGLITSTMLTLVVIPAAYMLLDKLTERLKKLFGSSGALDVDYELSAAE